MTLSITGAPERKRAGCTSGLWGANLCYALDMSGWKVIKWSIISLLLSVPFVYVAMASTDVEMRKQVQLATMVLPTYKFAMGEACLAGKLRQGMTYEDIVNIEALSEHHEGIEKPRFDPFYVDSVSVRAESENRASVTLVLTEWKSSFFGIPTATLEAGHTFIMQLHCKPPEIHWTYSGNLPDKWRPRSLWSSPQND